MIEARPLSHEPSVLLVDDDIEVIEAYRQTLELEGFAVRAHRDPRAALATITRDFIGAVLTDVRMPGGDGLDLLARIRALDVEIPVLVFTGHADVELAVRAMREGAYDFVEKPADMARLCEGLRRAVAHRKLVLENRALRQAMRDANTLDASLIGLTPAMERLRALVRTLADAQADVLVLGETGAGKERVARSLHDAGRRAGKPFVAINCGALPDSIIEDELFGHEPGAFTGATARRIGKIEHSSGGTLFLDEIESMPMAAQVRLLRVLQERTLERLGSNKEIALDLRVVAPTKVDLKMLVAQRLFREDLYYRLNVVTVRIPPLRERRSDVPLLFTRFLEQASARMGVQPPALPPRYFDRLLAHDWPGNVRELRNAAERVALGLGDGVGDESDAPDLTDTQGEATLDAILDRAERRALEDALARCGGRIARTAEDLGLTRKTLYLKMRRHGLDKQRFRDEARDEDDTQKDE